jgi:immune inhibitor A
MVRFGAENTSRKGGRPAGMDAASPSVRIGKGGSSKIGCRLCALLFPALALAGAPQAAFGEPHCIVRPYGTSELPSLRLDARSRSPAPSALRVAPSTGELHLLVILAEFLDRPHRIERERFEELIFGEFPSVRDYYATTSGARFAISGVVFGWVMLPQTQFFYSQDFGGVGAYPNNGQKMAEDAVTTAIAAGLDLTDHDVDGDGIVDALLVVHSGQGLEWSGVSNASTEPDLGAVNSHKWVVQKRSYGAGLPELIDYFTCPELQLVRPIVSPAWTDSISTIGVYCHEFGHILGLPDYYDGVARNLLGVWDIMDYGNWNRLSPLDPDFGAPGALPSRFSAWSRMFLGWTTPETLAPPIGASATSDFTLSSSSTGAPPLQLLANRFGVDWAFGNPGEGEFFLAELRTREGYDEGLPSSGVLLFHVDESRTSNLTTHNPDGRGLLLLVPRDGNTNVAPYDSIVNEPWPGAGESDFDASSNPSSRLFDGSESGLSLTDISLGGATASLTAMVENLVSELPIPFARPNPFHASTHATVDLVLSLEGAGASWESIEIFDVRGTRIRELRPPAVSEAGRIATWDGLTEEGRRAPAGVYLFRVRGSESAPFAPPLLRTGRVSLIR